MTSCAYRNFKSDFTKNREYQIRYNDCVEDRLYKVNPWVNFLKDRSLSYHVKNLNICTLYINESKGERALEQKGNEINIDDYTRTGINRRVAAKLAEIEAERNAYITRKDNFFLMALLPEFGTYDGSKVEPKKTDRDFIFVWSPFAKPVAREPPCVRITPTEQYVLMPTCVKGEHKVITGVDAPTFFECNLCGACPEDTSDQHGNKSSSH